MSLFYSSEKKALEAEKMQAQINNAVQGQCQTPAPLNYELVESKKLIRRAVTAMGKLIKYTGPLPSTNDAMALGIYLDFFERQERERIEREKIEKIVLDLRARNWK